MSRFAELPSHGFLQTCRALMPGSLVSLVLHVFLLFIVSAGLRGCQKGMTGEPGGDLYREVGLFVVDGSDSPDATADSRTEGLAEPRQSDPSMPTEDTPAESHTPTPRDLLPEHPPDVSEFLAQSNSTTSDGTAAADSELPALIGPGAPLAGLATGDSASSLITPSGGSQRAGTATPGTGQTAFMNIADSGRSFVYVIDISGSMGEGNRLSVALSQLKASLRLLQPTQQFQVIFYSDAPRRLSLRRQADRQMYYATEANKIQAYRQIDLTRAESGTEHMPALTDALSVTPDVIYFLTDGAEPQLSPRDLADLRRMAGRTTIHVIEFGSGTVSVRGVSWLQKLARQSGGEYRLIPVGE